MAILKRFFPSFISACSLVAMIVTWLAFAPTQAGGLASYIIVIGNSMEPRFHIGDLVIAHQEADYQVGDAVVYKNMQLNNFVFHRIIQDEMGTFTLQGDNNAWMDTYQPTRREIVGKLWIHVPKGGTYIQKIRNPIVMALAAGSLAGFLAIGLFRSKARGNKRMKQKSFQDQFVSVKQTVQNWFASSNATNVRSASGNMFEIWFFSLGALALASLIVGIIAFSKPASRISQNNISFEHVGFFSYSASAPQGVYDSNAIQSGDPIFPKLTCAVDVSFQYTFIAQDTANITGTHQLVATISEAISGWKRNIPLEEETPFHGNSFGATSKLNLCQIEALLQSMEAGTDFHAGSYLLTISPNIKVIGDIAGRALDGSFNPSLTFNYDRIHFYLLQDSEQGDVLNPTNSGAISEEHPVANTILLFGKELAIPALRWFAVFGLIGALGGIAFIGMNLQNVSKRDQSQFIRLRYDSILVDVQQTMLVNKADIVDVTSIEALAKLAEKFSTMILHVESADAHSYYVRDNGATYRFVLHTQTGSTVPAKDASS